MTEELPFLVEIYDAGEVLERVIARAGCPIVSWGAYNAAVQEFAPRRLVILRHKAHVMARSDR